MLSSRRLATCMTLSETWFREQQVLPLRTHPHMMHRWAGGGAGEVGQGRCR